MIRMPCSSLAKHWHGCLVQRHRHRYSHVRIVFIGGLPKCMHVVMRIVAFV